LITQSVIAQNIYPKILILENRDTVIAFTNQQILQFNKEHVMLKYCIEYSNIQDSTILDNNRIIKDLLNLNKSLMQLDSLSLAKIKTKDILLDIEKKEKERIQQSFLDFQKQIKKEKRKSWFLNSFIVVPVFVALTTILLIK
jgi:hypothetical protein